MKRLFAITGILLLTACGGGGGGGAPAPANLNSGSNNNGGNTGELKTGIFSDAPVAGLGFAQGSHHGVTDANGTFTYYSGSSQPVLFRLGAVELGSAMGADVVTPVDLSIEGKPVGRDGAVNMARVLITLDTDQNPDNGIALPDSVLAAGGNLPFTLNTQAFTEEGAVDRFMQKYAEGRSLVSSTVARNHLLENPLIKSWIDNDNAVVTAVIDDVDIAWNSNLREGGVLATFKANNKERLHVIVSGTDDLRLSNLVYVDQNNRYLTVAFGSDGNISHVDVNGTVEKIIVMRPQDPLALIDFTHYTPTLETLRMGSDGIVAAKPMASLQLANLALMDTILTRVLDAEAQARDMVVLGTELLAVVDSVLCAGKTSCDSSSLLQKSLQLALNDTTYYRNTLDFVDANLNQNECISVVAVSAQAPCAGSVPLTHLVALLMNSRSAIEAVYSDGMVVKEFYATKAIESSDEIASRVTQSAWRFVHREFSEDFLRSYNVSSSSLAETTVRVQPWFEVAVPVRLRMEAKRLSDGRAFYSVSVVNMNMAEMRYFRCEQRPAPNSDGLYHGADCVGSDVPRNSQEAMAGELVVRAKDVFFPRSGIWSYSQNGQVWHFPLDSKEALAFDNDWALIKAALATEERYSDIYIDRFTPLSGGGFERLDLAGYAYRGTSHISHPGIPGGGWMTVGSYLRGPFYPTP